MALHEDDAVGDGVASDAEHRLERVRSRLENKESDTLEDRLDERTEHCADRSDRGARGSSATDLRYRPKAVNPRTYPRKPMWSSSS